MLAYDRTSTLWDAARLLSVGQEGYAFRARVSSRLRAQPEFKEISEFFAAELSAQLADSRSTTTAKLDAPVNKLARLLNSPSIKRVLLNETLRVSLDDVIANGEVLIVKGALGTMGAGNTSVLMQLLVGMLDAALARRQDSVAAVQRNAVALKVDEAPLVLNRGFAETMALKRSVGLETVACWQTDSQWVDREVRDQLDALFAHRVYFATASVEDARNAASLMMAEYSDMIRSGIRNLSALGRPDVRLHLPKHSAIASWVTPGGRQAPFVAQTIPLKVDEQRLAFHAAAQAERGGRYLEDLSQPHWERTPQDVTGPSETDEPEPARSVPNSQSHQERGTPENETTTDLPPRERSAIPPESYRELVDLDAAHSVRWAKPSVVRNGLEAELLDIEILALVASMRHVLSSQIHRRFNPGRAMTTTQRRLKRLSDAGLLARFQFHRRDGGGVPMCYAISPTGRALLEQHGRGANLESTGSLAGEQLLRQARHDIRAAGVALAFERVFGTGSLVLKGPDESVLSPPSRVTADGSAILTPADLRLPGGRTPHDFLHTEPDGGRTEIDRFQTVRPDATLISTGARRELMIELDDRLPEGAGAAKLERYDHFLAGWSAHVKRYASNEAQLPFVVFVCRDAGRARECARRADHVLIACRAYAGEYPANWQYPSRERVVYAAERDIHEGVLSAYGVSALPPEVRVAAASGDPRAREPLVRECDISLGN